MLVEQIVVWMFMYFFKVKMSFKIDNKECPFCMISKHDLKEKQAKTSQDQNYIFDVVLVMKYKMM